MSHKMGAQKNPVTLETLIADCPARITQLLQPYLANIPAISLKQSMQYTLALKGKYLRPLFIYVTGLTCGASLENLDIPATAVELIHTYSLIHDDLPCMDNADLRRGQPACHKVYGDGMAVLTGDALHTLSMQLIAQHPITLGDHPLNDSQRVAMMRILARACGAYGMAAGQALDITEMNHTLSTEALLHIYQLKTGALFSACVELGWTAAPHGDCTHLGLLQRFGEHIGVAFQIQDDIVDIEMTASDSGKPQGIDQINQKITYPALHGLEAAKREVTHRYQQALACLVPLGDSADLLRQFCAYILPQHATLSAATSWTQV